MLGIASPLIFPACSGATTQDVIANGPLVGAKNGQTAPQIDELPPPEQLETALITIQIGGNDLKLDANIQQCMAGLKKSTSIVQSATALSQLSPQCKDLDWLLDNFNTTVNENFEASLEYTFEALRNAAPNTPIIAVGYPHLVDATSACSGFINSMISPIDRQRMNDLADAINAKIASAAQTAGILSITDEVVTAFAGREACAPQEMIGSLTMHPNAAGHQAYAQLVASRVPPVITRTTSADPTPPDGTDVEPGNADEPPAGDSQDDPPAPEDGQP
jgi:lysophospholipase L1-like esterase